MAEAYNLHRSSRNSKDIVIDASNWSEYLNFVYAPNAGNVRYETNGIRFQIMFSSDYYSGSANRNVWHWGYLQLGSFFNDVISCDIEVEYEGYTDKSYANNNVQAQSFMVGNQVAALTSITQQQSWSGTLKVNTKQNIFQFGFLFRTYDGYTSNQQVLIKKLVISNIKR